MNFFVVFERAMGDKPFNDALSESGMDELVKVAKSMGWEMKRQGTRSTNAPPHPTGQYTPDRIKV